MCLTKSAVVALLCVTRSQASSGAVVLGSLVHLISSVLPYLPSLFQNIK